MNTIQKLDAFMKMADETGNQMTELKLDTFNLILDAYEKNEPTFWTSVLSILKSYTIQEEEITDKLHAAALNVNQGD